NEWAAGVRKRFSGASEFSRNVRQWLFSADMDELDGARQLADDQGFMALKTRIAEVKGDAADIPVRKYLDDLVGRAEKLNDLCKKIEKYAAKEKHNFIDIADDLPRLETVRASKAKAEANPDVRAILGENWNKETDTRHFARTMDFLRDYLAADSMAGLAEKFFSSDFSNNWKNYIQDRAGVQAALERSDVLGLSVDKCGDFEKESALPFSALIARLDRALENPDSLNQWISFNSHMEKAKSDIKADLLDAYLKESIGFETIPLSFEYLVYGALAREIYSQNSQLKRYNGHSLEQARARLKELDEEILALQREELCRELNKEKPLSGIGSGRKASWTEGPLIHNELSKQKRHIPIRDLMRRAGTSIQKIKPCFLMSPLTVAQYLQPGQFTFDLVVIDEASQMRPEDALGGIARAKQVVVVGDPQQLPPTSFFQQTGADDDSEEEEDFNADAIMDMALSSFRPARILSRHYRSQHESLIAFSNHHFYDRSLILFPSPVKNPDELGVRLEYVGGTYAANSNMDEVQAVVKSALDFMRRYPDRSLGIATMNQVQKELLESEMDRAFIEHPHATKYKARWQNTLESFFVKNLESVQGDERDAIFISTVYGPDKTGAVMQRFGPINRAGGYRRLNVLFTRAKKNMVVFTSLKPEDIKASDTSSDGLRAFRGFLAYASKGFLDEGKIVRPEADSDFEVWVKERLESIGCEVHPQVGVAGYRIDLGVKHPKYPYGYIMGIECDGATYHSSKSARERDIIRQQILENLGWKIYRIWSTDWFANPVQEFDKLRAYIETILENDNFPVVQQENTVIEHDFTPDEKEDQNDLFTERTTAAEPPRDTLDVVQLFDSVTYLMLKDGGK
ncbi:MAG TPA: AAA domain-containing protein, partial [Alphaproteobacteria bacterium]|nr:AAA domain-containing protein [Alphaproteobacteria bacterium]